MFVVDEPHHTSIVLKLDEEVGVVYWCAVMGQQGEEEGPEHVSLGGHSMMVLYALLPTRSASGLPVSKSNNQLQREMFSPRQSSFCISCWGMIVLKAELKSKNSILTYESLLSRWLRAEWRVVEIASTVQVGSC